jgi:4-amino-4-deoxy-L-arabinose transferase-like glycosyltransferase
MPMILTVGESIGLIIGSLAAAVLLCFVVWRLFKLMRHPEWGPPLLLVLVALAVAGKLPHSEFLDMVIVFAALAAIPLWFEGRAWRKRHTKISGHAVGYGIDHR